MVNSRNWVQNFFFVKIQWLLFCPLKATRLVLDGSDAHRSQQRFDKFFFFFLQNFSAIQYQLVPPQQHTQAVVCSTMLRPLQSRGMLMQLLVSKVLLIKSRGGLLYEAESEMWTSEVPLESLESMNLFCFYNYFG